MIRLEAISKKFGSVEAIRSLDLDVRDGEWLGLLGHNGSGKTTLIRVLLGLSQPSSGRILLDGEPAGDSGWRLFRSKLGFMPERISFYENLTGQEILRYFCALRGAPLETVPVILERVGLADAAARKVGGYSKGMRQRLNLAQALLGEPEMLVMDEPIEGLDPHGVHELFDLVRDGGVRTVVISSHRLSEVSDRVDRVCILGDGNILALGSVEELFEKLDLPVRVHIYPTQSLNGTLTAALQRLGPDSIVEKDGVLVVEVSQEAKAAFLFGLQSCQEAIRHLHVEEPSLERVYFEAD